MKLTLAAEDTPEGYASEAEYRFVNVGEIMLSANCEVRELTTVCCVGIVLTPKRWRAEHNGEYYHVTSFGTFVLMTEYFKYNDDRYYEIGNYFRTEKEALKYAVKWREIFKP